jgi:RimJ/RimL family protein N-acetyltransferase
MAAEIQRRLGLQKAGSMLPFAVLDPEGQAVGMTTYMNIDAANRRVEIGSTWYRKSVQRTPLNTEAKRLLLAHAFETLDCIAVEFRTHWFNQPAAAASNAWAPSSTACCVATRSTATPMPPARCATPASTASWRTNGRA